MILQWVVATITTLQLNPRHILHAFEAVGEGALGLRFHGWLMLAVSTVAGSYDWITSQITMVSNMLVTYITGLVNGKIYDSKKCEPNNSPPLDFCERPVRSL